jgi:hypothetical protein
VRRRRGRFAELGLPELAGLSRSGRPRRISEEDREAVVALACQLPAATGVPLSRWTKPELSAELTAQGMVSAPLPASSVLRILAENPVKPWRYQFWIYPRDRDFASKASVILDLYRGFTRGSRSGPGTGSCPSTRRPRSRPAPAFLQAGEVVGETTFLWMTEKKKVVRPVVDDDEHAGPRSCTPAGTSPARRGP